MVLYLAKKAIGLMITCHCSLKTVMTVPKLYTLIIKVSGCLTIVVVMIEAEKMVCK